MWLIITHYQAHRELSAIWVLLHTMACIGNTIQSLIENGCFFFLINLDFYVFIKKKSLHQRPN